MKYIKSIILFVVVSMVVVPSALALGDEKLTSISYNMGVPTNDLKDFTGNTSYRGFGIQGRWFLKTGFSVGLAWEWQVFDFDTQEPLTTTANLGSITIGGQQYRYVNAFPFLATAHLYLGHPGSTRLFVGAGAGVYYMMERFEVGILALEDNQWLFGGAPEAGVLAPVGDIYGHQNILLSAKYNYVFGKDNGIDFTWWEAQIGITWNPEF